VDVYGRPEKWEMDVIFNFFESYGFIKGSAIDVGANIGMHTLLFSRYYNNIYSFEPHPKTFKLLDINIQDYANNATPYNLAAYSSEGEIEFSSQSWNIGGFAINPNFNKVTKGFKTIVKTVCLDSVTEISEDAIGLIKIDVEGAEYEVLKGSEVIISKNKPIIIMECWDSQKGEARSITYLRSLGYQYFLYPVILPIRRSGFFGKIVTLFKTLISGGGYGIAFCEFNEKSDYELLIAVHGDNDL